MAHSFIKLGRQLVKSSTISLVIVITTFSSSSIARIAHLIVIPALTIVIFSSVSITVSGRVRPTPRISRAMFPSFVLGDFDA
jgi:hypothetical protein